MAGPTSSITGGVKIAGSNVVPRIADLADPYQICSYRMFTDWLGDATVRTHWFLPQLNAAVAGGANAVRFFWDPFYRFGSLTTMTQAQWFGILDQIQADCEALGLWMVMGCTSVGMTYGHDSLSVTTQNAVDFITESVAHTSVYPNMFYYDIVQEIANSGRAGTWVWDNMSSWIGAAKSARAVALPVSCSYVIFSSTAELTTANQDRVAVLAAGGDICDIHLYIPCAVSDLNALVADAVPLYISEVGCGQDGSLPNTGLSTTPTACYDLIAGLGAKNEIQGVMQWSLTGLGPVYGDYGLYDGVQNGSFVFTGLRSVQATRFATVPKTVQSFASGGGVNVLSSPPTITGKTDTTVSLSWDDAENVTSPTYTPQYAKANSTRQFPIAPWVSGTPTSSKTQTLRRLVKSTKYLFRVSVAG